MVPAPVSASAAEAVFSWEDGVAAIQAAYSSPIERRDYRNAPLGEPTVAGYAPCRHYQVEGTSAPSMGMSTTAPSPGVQYVVVLYDQR